MTNAKEVMDDFPTSKDAMPKNVRDVLPMCKTYDVIIKCETQPLAQGDEGYK